MPSSSAIQRLDQPLSDKLKSECCKSTLSSLIEPKSSPGCSERNTSRKGGCLSFDPQWLALSDH